MVSTFLHNYNFLFQLSHLSWASRMDYDPGPLESGIYHTQYAPEYEIEKALNILPILIVMPLDFARYFINYAP